MLFKDSGRGTQRLIEGVSLRARGRRVVERIPFKDSGEKASRGAASTRTVAQPDVSLGAELLYVQRVLQVLYVCILRRLVLQEWALNPAVNLWDTSGSAKGVSGTRDRTRPIA